MSTFLETIKDATLEAGEQYARGVERLFDKAQALVAKGELEDAELVAKIAAKVRMDARFELRRR